MPETTTGVVVTTTKVNGRYFSEVIVPPNRSNAEEKVLYSSPMYGNESDAKYAAESWVETRQHEYHRIDR